MTDLTREGLVELADRLTPAQYTALWNMQPRGTNWQLAPHDGWRRAGQACSNLCKLGYAERSSPGTRFADAPAYRLTDNGAELASFIRARAMEAGRG